jgi:16S rRNA (adenine1518-N6/adenine1519-N6)-dimethyltransferase
MESWLTGSRSGLTFRSSRSAGPRPRAKKRFGQHFLSDVNILRRIVDAAEIARDDAALEVGPGLGSLTAVLAERAKRVVAVEIDRDLIDALVQRFSGTASVTIVEADVLDHAPGELLERGAASPPFVVVANLPYNVASAVLRHFLEGDVRSRRIVAMVQLEVGEAIVARPGNMSLLSVATQVYGEANMVMRVAPGAFNPPPAVESAVVRVDVASEPRVDVPLDAFFRIVRAGFGNPRKQLRNSLSFGLHVKQSVVDEVLAAADIDVTLRPQMLALEQWASVTRAWIERMRQ